jgi:TetR/AcrR family transcriptional regulator
MARAPALRALALRAGASRGRTRIQAENEERILAAALEEFSIHGFRGATIDKIAGRASMSKPNLLYYFARKQDVYVAVLQHTLRNWLEPLTTLDPDGEPAEEIWGYIQRKLALSRSAPAASRLFANEVLQGAPRIRSILEGPLKDLVAEKCAVIQGWVDAGRLRPVDPLHLLFMIWATTQHYADFEVQIDALSDAPRADRFASAERTLRTIFLNGLLPL